ncbi:metallohydrolase [Mesorhizobium caraganae]|uniref:metallohydrolase n=1 Tax=Mesorhizobium caraganae TaxID=483206 RepID=UPI003ECEAB76
MADKLLIRAYSVRCGDCIYVRIPDARIKDGNVDDFHILIDCGTKAAGDDFLKPALDLLKPELPLEDGKHRLDLVVVSHGHDDHMKGFDPEWFEDVAIENLWLSAAMNPEHPQAELAHAFHDLADRAMVNVAARGVALSPALQDIVDRYGINPKGAIKALTETLPQQNGIDPVYLHTESTAADLELETLQGDVAFHVLGPDINIDFYYGGDQLAADFQTFSKAAAGVIGAPQSPSARPENISALDFLRLQSRMMSNAFAYSEENDRLINNTSIMLLLEWRGRRLLFVGDAEWDDPFEEGTKANGAWNVAWNKQRAKLDGRLDFLKVGHHGSTNSTPWNEDGTQTESSTILDAILPLPADNMPASGPKAVVSTARTPYKPIPSSALMVELGKRVANTETYGPLLTPSQIAGLPNYAGHEKALLGQPQPQRTDMEALVTGTPYVEIEIKPVAGH